MENLLNLNIKSVTIDKGYENNAVKNGGVNNCLQLPSYGDITKPSTSQRCKVIEKN